MEGKFHDKPDKYSRKGRQQMAVDQELAIELTGLGWNEGEESMRKKVLVLMKKVMNGEHSGDFKEIAKTIKEIETDE